MIGTAGRGMRLLILVAVLAPLAAVPAGCYLFGSAQKEYLSNQEYLTELAGAVGCRVNPDLYRLVGAEIGEDSLTLQYRGVPYVGDSAWIVRFSVKSTEQDPVALADVYPLLPVLAESRKNFKVIEDGERPLGATKVEFVRYRFDSPVRDPDGKPLRAHGILMTFRVKRGDDTLVFHVKLDNHGDREQVAWEDAEPLLKPLVEMDR